MLRQGPSVAIGRLHPEFVLRLAHAIREARAAGLSEAGIFSAYRPPAFGVGGFVDKFNSLHSYGLAVDVYGIGMAGSAEALLWHGIGARHGIVCPYGPLNPVEWNHCQPTKVTIVRNENPLRETITPDGPISLEGMFEVGNAVIVDPKDAGVPIHPLPATPTKPGIAAVAEPSSSRAVLANVATRGTVIVISERLRAVTGGKAGAKSATKSGFNTASKTAAKPAPQKLADAYDAKRRTAFAAKGRERPALRLPKLSGETVGAWADKPVAPTVASTNDGKRI
jgi:hypothetical protein